MKLIKNDKLYRYTDDGSLIMVRLKKIKNEDKFIVYDDNKEEYTLNAEEIKKYTKRDDQINIKTNFVALSL